jgi:hypothetical protein
MVRRHVKPAPQLLIGENWWFIHKVSKIEKDEFFPLLKLDRNFCFTKNEKIKS